MSAAGWFGQGVDGAVMHADRHAWYGKREGTAPRLADVNPDFPPHVVNPGTKDAWIRKSTWPPMPVKLKSANGFGLHDMVGNVFEYVSDWAHAPRHAGWADTECGFLFHQDVGEDAYCAPPAPGERGAGWTPVLFGQPFTPGMVGDEAWGSYFQKMPHLGFRVAEGGGA